MKRKNDQQQTPKKMLESAWYEPDRNQMVFSILTWCGFSLVEAWAVLHPQSSAKLDSQSVLATRYGSHPSIKEGRRSLNYALARKGLKFKDFGGYKAEYSDED